MFTGSPKKRKRNQVDFPAASCPCIKAPTPMSTALNWSFPPPGGSPPAVWVWTSRSKEPPMKAPACTNTSKYQVSAFSPRGKAVTALPPGSAEFWGEARLTFILMLEGAFRRATLAGVPPPAWTYRYHFEGAPGATAPGLGWPGLRSQGLAWLQSLGTAVAVAVGMAVAVPVGMAVTVAVGCAPPVGVTVMV